MSTYLFRAYALIAYVLGLVSVVFYADFFMGYKLLNTVFGPQRSEMAYAIAIDAILLLAFTVQHSLMARPHIKARMRKWVPYPMERSTYILFSALWVFAMVLLWQPIPFVIFDLRGSQMAWLFWTIYAIGWFFTLFSTFLIDHFDLFGLKQAFQNGGDGEVKYKLVTPFFYKVIRHPIYLGWFLVHWATPYMTLGQLFLAAYITLYMYVAIHWEERDLIDSFGTRYLAYKRHTAKILPSFRTLRYHFKFKRQF